MKKFLKIVGITILVVIIAIIAIPFLFKGQLLEVAKDQINKNVNANVNFNDFDVSIFKSFPSLTVTLDELSVVGKDKFENDTLAYIKQLFVDVNIMSVINGDSYEITSVIIDSPTLNAIVLKDSSANWDIAPASTDTIAEIKEETPSEDTATLKLALELVEIKNANISYRDYAGNTHAWVKNLNYSLSGNMADDVTSLDMLLSIEKVTAESGNITYVNEAEVTFDAVIDANLATSSYAFSKNSFKINALEIQFDGLVAMENDDIKMGITFNAPQTEFKQILSLVPAIYKADFQDVQTNGKVSLNGSAKGILSDKPEQYPTFDLNLNVADAMFRYPDLPSSAENIGIDLNISNKSSQLDDMVINLKKFHIELSKNPFDATLVMKTPLSDPFIEASFNGKIDLGKIKDIVPLDSTEMNGLVETNIELAGNASTLENEKYEEFKALGNIILSNFTYSSPDVPTSVTISKTELVFSPQFVDLKSFDAKLGKSDVHMDGKLENFIPYALADGTLKGTLNLHSNYFNANDYIEEDTTVAEEIATIEDTAKAVEVEPIEPIPANIDFVLNSSFGTVDYEQISIKDIEGLITVKDSKVDISNLKMKMLGGTMSMKGFYSTQDISNPNFDFDLDISNFNFVETYNFSGMVQKLAPIIKKCNGNYSTKLKLNSSLQNDYSPLLSSLNGFGVLESDQVEITDSKTLNFVGEKVKGFDMSQTKLKDLLMQFTIEDGGINVKPFETNLNSAKAVINGVSRLDQTIDFKIATQIPQKMLGGKAQSLISSLSQEASKKGIDAEIGENIDLDILLTGNMFEPMIKLALGESTAGATKSLKSQAKAELDKKKAELEAKAKAEAEAAKAKVKAEAEKRKAEAEAKAKAEADKAKQKAKEEADKKKNELKNEAKDKLKKMW